MRLGKRTVSAMLAWTLAAAVAGTGISVPVPQKVQAEETESETEAAAAASAEEGIAPAAEETETAVVIDKVTIADTYYSVNGKLPLYVEYFTAEAPEDFMSGDFTLTVTKEDGTVVAESVDEHHYDYNLEETFGSFQSEECAGVEIGKTYPLTFIIKDTSSGKEIFKETRKVGFEEKDAWADREYLPTNQTYYAIDLYIATEAALEETSSIDGVCLLDKDNQVAADGRKSSVRTTSYDNRYGNIFYQNPYRTGWQYAEISSYSVYRTRKLQAGEVLTVAYSVDGTVIPTDCKVTVTDQPYITSFYETPGIYSGEEYAETVVLQGLHVDFDQVSFVLKDRRTGKEVARSVSSITDSSNSAYYAVVWNEEYKDKKPVECDIEYQYADKEKQLIAEQANRDSFSATGTEDILWNPKTDSIEYHNSKLPAGTEVSYRVRISSSEEVTGSGITVDSNHHMEVELKETFLYEQWVDLYVSYLDAEGNERTVSDDVRVYQNKQPTDSGSGSGGSSVYSIYSSIMNPMYYLSDSACAFSPELICNDESKLAATGSAVIYNAENQEAGTVELSQEKLNNNRFVYKGTYKNGLKPGKYRLNFAPDKTYEASYDFYVQDRTILGLRELDGFISSGYIGLYFTSKDIAEWYCSEENQKKLSVKLLDIHDREIAAYTWKDGDFNIEDGTSHWFVYGNNGSYSSTPKRLEFSKEVKEELDKIYYCRVCVYYDGKEAVYAEHPADVIRDTYVRSADSESSWIEMGYDNKYVSPEKGKYTYNCIRGNESAFPAVLTITDWYSMKTIKEIPIEAAGILKEEDLQGLSGNKVYGCYLKGADGSVRHQEGYLSKGKEYHYYHPWWTTFSDLYPVSGDFDVTFEFTNKSDGYTNYENYLVCFTNAFEAVSKIPSENEGYQEYYVLRADAWGWSDLDENTTLEGNPVTYTYDWTWEQFRDIMKDAKVTMNIKRTGDDFVVDAKILGADGKNYSYVTKFTTKADQDMTIFFTCEHADVSILSFQDNKAVQPPEQGGGGIVVVPPQPEITRPAEETKPEETPSEDTNKEETQPEETPSEDTNKEETPEKTPSGDTGKEDTKEPEKEENNQTENNKSNTKAKGKLTLKKTKLVINKGQKAKIKITSKLNTKVTYRSLNKKVAAVSSKGIVTAKKKGKAVIVVKANGKRRKVTVTVKGASAEAKNGVKLKKDFSLSVSKAVLKKGSKLEIQQASGISGKVTYRSLNKKIATVSAKGMIKARKKGKTAILIKNGKKTIKLKITVTV